MLLLLLTLRISNQWLPSPQSPSLLDTLSPFSQSTGKKSLLIPFVWLVMHLFFSSLLVLSSMSPSSWLMDSACCKHMTPHLSSFSQFEPAPRPLNIHIVNSSTMFVHNIGSLLTSNLSIPRVFNVPNLSYNFFFFFFFCMGQLAKLSYCITFDYSRCTVLDPRM